jgi:hypothetical protein
MDHLPKGSLVSPYTKAVVKHLRTHGPSTLEQLDTMIQRVGNWVADGKTVTALSKVRLSRMLHAIREGGHVHRVLRDDRMLWVDGPNPNTTVPAALAVVQAPRIDLMRAPLYVPDAGPALRAGALNFKACASFGQRC